MIPWRVENQFRLLRQSLREHAVQLQAQREGIIFLPPAYDLVDDLNADSIIVDIGTGFDADYSRNLIQRYGLRSFGFDPTRKHQPGLQQLSAQTGGRFQINPFALAGTRGTLTFFESDTNTSGSVLTDHINAKHDAGQAYNVSTLTLADILERIPAPRIDLLKIDSEGTEYDVLLHTPAVVFERIGQLNVEFHHHCIDRFTLQHTRQVINRLRSLGFIPFTRDRFNYLFFRPRKLRFMANLLAAA